MAKSKKKTTSAIAIMDRRFFGTDVSRESLADTRLAMTVGDKIRRLREERNMTQDQLGKQIGTTRSGVSRIEDADYDGHSVATLQRIAHALDMRLIIDYERLAPREMAKQM